jgi:hypothetical protein
MGENIVTTPAEQASERAIIEAATPGPWEVDATKALGAYGVYHGLSTDRPSRVCSMLPCELPRDRRDANAAFIAAARTGWPKALDERDAAIARAERAEAACQLLARLAADTPQFDNPLHVYEAKRIRDAILEGRTP